MVVLDKRILFLLFCELEEGRSNEYVFTNGVLILAHMRVAGSNRSSTHSCRVANRPCLDLAVHTVEGLLARQLERTRLAEVVAVAEGTRLLVAECCPR